MNEKILLISGRTILILIILFILTKLMGKKQVNQMNLFDYLIGITIGSIAADISLDIEKNLLGGILSLIIYGLSGVLVTYLSLKNLKIRRIVCGKPTILMENGKIIEHNMYKEGIDINDLQEEARQNGYFDLNKINYAILETNGKVSFQANSEEENITKKDMKIKEKEEPLAANIIIDGTLLRKNLELMNKDEKWLMKELKKHGYNDYQNILLMTLNPNGKTSYYEKNISTDTNIFE